MSARAPAFSRRLELQPDLESGEERGDRQNDGGEDYRSENAGPGVVEMCLEVSEADGGDEEVVEVRQQVSEQRVCAGGPREEGPVGFLPYVAEPVQNREGHNGS